MCVPGLSVTNALPPLSYMTTDGHCGKCLKSIDTFLIFHPGMKNSWNLATVQMAEKFNVNEAMLTLSCACDNNSQSIEVKGYICKVVLILHILSMQYL